MCESSGNVERHNDPRHRSHRPCGGRRLQVGVTRPRRGRNGPDVQAASGCLPSGIALRVADYEDASALKRALAGIDDMVLISSDGYARAVMRHHVNIISAATAAGLRHITFTSIVDVEPRSPFYYAPVYRDAERRLEDGGIPTAIIRCGLYSDFILEHWLAPSP